MDKKSRDESIKLINSLLEVIYCSTTLSNYYIIRFIRFISAKWIANGDYSVKSAYLVQLHGMQVCLMAGAFGARMQRESTNSLLGSLFSQKILTTDNLIRKNWPAIRFCLLCDQELETVAHLCVGLQFC